MSISPQLVASHGLGSTPLQIALFGLLSVEDAPATCIALCLRVSLSKDALALSVALMPDVCEVAAALSPDFVGSACEVAADVVGLQIAMEPDVEALSVGLFDVLTLSVALNDCNC